MKKLCYNTQGDESASLAVVQIEIYLASSWWALWILRLTVWQLLNVSITNDEALAARTRTSGRHHAWLNPSASTSNDFWDGQCSWSKATKQQSLLPECTEFCSFISCLQYTPCLEGEGVVHSLYRVYICKKVIEVCYLPYTLRIENTWGSSGKSCRCSRFFAWPDSSWLCDACLAWSASLFSFSCSLCSCNLVSGHQGRCNSLSSLSHGKHCSAALCLWFKNKSRSKQKLMR